MLCRIAELIVEVPATGDLIPRCMEYRYEGNKCSDIIIHEEQFRPNAWQGLTGNDYVYCESGNLFYVHLLRHNGVMLHASVVAMDGKAYLFSAPSGTGKSTHTKLWQQVFGEEAKVFNDDKPALRRLDGTWYAYGTPWCGKDGININLKAPVAGICFLKQASENQIRRLSQAEAISKIVSQTLRRFKLVENMDLMLSHVEKIVQEIPVFELENRPEPAAAQLSYETMRKAAEEAGL